jgi:hypothetical protein
MRVGTGFSSKGTVSGRALLDSIIGVAARRLVLGAEVAAAKFLYIGDQPTYWMEPGVPHGAYPGEFLMRTKAVIRD